MQVWCSALMLAMLVAGIAGHGMVIKPPARSTMWRYGFQTPVNYNDNELYCGGFSVQWNVNKGQCGLCGDDFRLKRPRPNEHGGKYGTGVIAATYAPGDTIVVRVKLTANHRGFFRFALCNLEQNKIETDECFRQFPLKLSTGESEYHLPSFQSGEYDVLVKLPDGLATPRAVLQWTYTTGNNWGICPDGQGQLGCGPQETFRTCSDIAIVRSTSSLNKMLGDSSSDEDDDLDYESKENNDDIEDKVESLSFEDLTNLLDYENKENNEEIEDEEESSKNLPRFWEIFVGKA